MKFVVITLFPDFVKSLEQYSIIGRAIKDKKIKLQVINLRDFGIGKYKQVDDKPYGGGPGMLLRVDVMAKAIGQAKKTAPKSKVVLLSPEGNKFDQAKAKSYAENKNLIIVCGHYEGFDERIKSYADEVVSLGDYVVSGGEIPAMIVIDAVYRLIPGVLGNPDSLANESFQIPAINYRLSTTNYDFPQYTRPEKFEGAEVPEILISGNHREIEKWRKSNKKQLDEQTIS